MEDKRITKTKRALKSALLELLTTQACQCQPDHFLHTL